MQTEISHLDTVPKLAGSFVSTEGPAEKRQLGNERDKKSSRRKSTPRRKVDVGKTTNELYRDMHIQAELCLLVSSKARTSENTMTLEPMLYNKDLDKEIPPVAIDDVDVALPYDVWEGLEIANPQAPPHSELYSKLTMYFQVDATENVNVDEIAIEMSRLRDSGVRVDIGRYAAYKDFMEGRKKTEAGVIESWHNFERKRRLKERTRACNATIVAMKKQAERFKKLNRQEEANELSNEVLELEKEVKNPDRVDAELAIVHSEELLKYTNSRVGTFNQGHPPAVDTDPMFRDIQTDQRGQVYREHLRKNLYKFGLNADFWYETIEHPHPAKGVVCFKYNAMMLQDRKLGTPVNTPGGFLARCDISHEIVYRNSNTGRPLTHTHDNTAWKHCPNLAKYIRACRYRMEVVRLWYKLFTNQAPEIIAQMMEQSGIVDQADEKISAIKERIGGRRKAVLAVVEFGDKGALRLPTILPSYKATMPDPESEEIVYEIVDRAKFELELKSDDPYGPEVQERGNYTWPIQKIDNTNTWFRFSENIQGRNVFTLKLLEALFKDDIAATWDWKAGAIPENVKSLFLTQHQTTDEFDEARAYEEMELVFDSIIEAIPLWAQAYLSTELVDDSVLDWEQDQDWKKLVDPGFQETEHLKKTVAESKEKVNQYERAIGAAKSAKSDTATVEELVEKRKKEELQYWKHLAKLNTLVRDNVFASFTWNGYAVDNESKREYADAEQDAGATSSWAKTQLFRCCYEVDTRPVEQDGNARPPPGHQAVTYFIGFERKQDTRQIQIGIRGFDRKVLVPGEPAVDLWYASWYIEKVLKRGVGNVGQLVTMQNMFKFLNSDNPQYVQVQGQWGTNSSLQPRTSQIHLHAIQHPVALIHKLCIPMRAHSVCLLDSRFAQFCREMCLYCERVL
jgi:hypothetical protein